MNYAWLQQIGHLEYNPFYGTVVQDIGQNKTFLLEFPHVKDNHIRGFVKP